MISIRELRGSKGLCGGLTAKAAPRGRRSTNGGQFGYRICTGQQISDGTKGHAFGVEVQPGYDYPYAKVGYFLEHPDDFFVHKLHLIEPYHVP